MASDVLYYYDKTGSHTRKLLGEIQTNFNSNIVIDGTKDSMQVDVYSFVERQIEPNTIVKHQATGTWWIVKSDIVKRYANESGFYYHHSLTLNGALELLNARDLTDCGFNDRTYTIEEFIKRLFKLSTFEYNFGNNIYYHSIDKNKIVDYIKSYENYTLLSALRDFLSGYNCEAKLTFTEQHAISTYRIRYARLDIIPKTGRLDLDVLDINTFDDVRETISQSKESYATTVISNAQNVVSTQTKTYPQIGGTSLVGDTYNTQSKNLFFRTPTNIYDVVWIKAMSKVRYWVKEEGQTVFKYQGPLFFPQSNAEFENAVNDLERYYFGESGNTHFTEEQRETLRKYGIGCSQITFYNNGFDYNIHTHVISKKDDTPYLALMKYADPNEMRTMVLADKNTRDGMYEGYLHALYWERGENKINGFNIFFDTESMQFARDTYYASRTDLHLFGLTTNKIFQDKDVMVGLGQFGHDVLNSITRDNTMWQIKYIPMSDIKIKHDNENNTLDSHIYNQNGKLNDSVALSKLINSYSKEIQSPTITRFMKYNSYDDIPLIGQLVDNNGKKYVINNISYDFFPNESDDDTKVNYYIECEFTLSEYVSTKSIMTSPNSNIRDYGIPQKYNVKRRQVYRDYYEFSLHEENGANQTTPYVGLDKYFPISYDFVQPSYDHTAIIKITYADEVSGHTEWYYQLSSTAYVMKKEIYELVDFNDNNIIGYDMQNAETGFNMSNLYDSTYRNIITPISYVDEKGKFEGISLAMVNPDKLSSLYDSILDEYGNYDIQTLSSHVFVGENFYNGSSNGRTKIYDDVVWYVDTISGISNVDITGYLNGYSGDASDLSFRELVCKNALTDYIGVLNTDYTYQIVKEDNRYYFRLTPLTTAGAGLNALFIDTIYRNGYSGAKDIADYVLEEEDYQKDAIEVPVFEYSLQIGDSEEVEVGDNILEVGEGIVSLYSCVIKNKNSTSQLNASEYFEDDTTIKTDSTTWNVSIPYGVILEFDQNDILKVKVRESSNATISKVDGVNTLVGTSISSNVIAKEDLIDKDIIVYKTRIENVAITAAAEPYSVTTKDLVMIIHGPSSSNFVGNDIIVNVNYYKLK